jgi:predicted Zn-dependent peptidase
MQYKPEVFELSNGIKVAYLQNTSAVAHLGLTFMAGSRFDTEPQMGLAHFLEHCIFKGTHKRKVYHVLSRLDAVGGELNAYTAKEEMVVYASFSKMYLNRACELLADIVVHSNFPEKEIEKEKEIIIDEINSYLDSPSDRIFDEFEALLFDKHSLGYNILGTPETVRSFTRQDLLDFIGTYFVTHNMAISFVGNVSKKTLIQQLEKHFLAVPKGERVAFLDDFEYHAALKKRVKESNYQSHVVIGGPAPSYKEDHRRGMTLLTNILGGPALNSRLTLSIREKYGYAYNVESSYTTYADTGFWSIYLGTDEKNMNKAIQLVYKELKKIRTQKLGTLQLNQAKEQLKGQIALGMDSNTGLMLGLGKSLLMFGQIDTIQEIHHEIDKLTAEELLEIANLYFKEEVISELVYDLMK